MFTVGDGSLVENAYPEEAFKELDDTEEAVTEVYTNWIADKKLLLRYVPMEMLMNASNILKMKKIHLRYLLQVKWVKLHIVYHRIFFHLKLVNIVNNIM